MFASVEWGKIIRGKNNPVYMQHLYRKYNKAIVTEAQKYILTV